MVNPFANGPKIMGVVNVTPDSFSDGGQFYNPDTAIAHGVRLVEEGADILDIGGESSRPGADIVDVKTEIARVVPVIEGLRDKAKWISVDTRNALSMEAALKAGANVVNDITALSYDARSVEVVAAAGVPVFFMHMQGDPQIMQDQPLYNDVVEDVFAYLEQRIAFFESRGIARDLMMCDVGIGFGKTLVHNLALLKNLDRFHDLGVPILLGTSRKSFIGNIDENVEADDRLAGSLSSALYGLSQGVQVFRVHDVAAHRQAFKVWDAINQTT